MVNVSHWNKTKTQIVKKEAGGGNFLNTLVNKLSFEMRLPGHKYTGSGTKLYECLNSDRKPKGVEYTDK